MNLLEEASTEFTTERLRCSRCDPSFTHALYEAAIESVDTIYPWLPWCHPDYQLTDARDWLEFCGQEWQSGQQYAFSIFDQTGRLIGGCGLNKLDQHPVANLGYWLRSSATGQGYAIEATRGLAQFAFTQLDFKRLEIIMSVNNNPSRQVAIGAGATFEGTLRNRLSLHGELHDAYLYSLVND